MLKEKIQVLARYSGLLENDFNDQCVYLYKDYFNHGEESILCTFTQPHQVKEILSFIRNIYYKSTL